MSTERKYKKTEGKRGTKKNEKEIYTFIVLQKSACSVINISYIYSWFFNSIPCQIGTIAILSHTHSHLFDCSVPNAHTCFSTDSLLCCKFNGFYPSFLSCSKEPKDINQDFSIFVNAFCFDPRQYFEWKPNARKESKPYNNYWKKKKIRLIAVHKYAF